MSTDYIYTCKTRYFKQFTGISDPFEAPENPELKVFDDDISETINII